MPYLFEAIASILGYLRDHHHPYSYSGEIKGGDTIYPRIAILRQNLRHQGDLVANKRIVETLRDGGEIKVVERVAKEEGDTDFGRLLQRILKDDLEGITSWSKREGSTTYYAYSRRNPWQASGGGI